MFCKTNDNLSLYYEVKGNIQSEKVLVFLNGLSQSTVSWAFFLPYFEKQYKVILLDFIFQGQSDKTGEWRSFDQHAHDVLSVLNQEKINTASIIGISYGSLVAQHFTLNYPDRLDKLVLLSTFAHKTQYFEVIEHSWWRALETGGYALMFDIMLPNVLSEDYFKNPLIPVETLRALREQSNTNKDALLKLMQATKERKDYRKDLQKITAPTLVMHGEKDSLITLTMGAEVANNIPKAQFKIILNAGHTLNLEKVSEVTSEIIRFLS